MAADTNRFLAPHERLFADLGEELGIEDLGFNENGVCVMSFDDIVLRFEYQQDQDDILVISEISDLDSDASADVLMQILSINAASAASGGGSVGVDGESGKLVWFDRLAPRGVTQAKFQKWIEAALARHEAWLEMLPALFSGPVEKDAAPSFDGPIIRV